MTCKAAGQLFRPARLEDGASMGQDVSFDDCLRAVQAADEGVVCGLQKSEQYRLHKVEELATGAHMAFEDCLRATGARTYGSVLRQFEELRSRSSSLILKTQEGDSTVESSLTKRILTKTFIVGD